MIRYIRSPKINRTEEGKRYYSTVIPRTPVLSEFPTEYTARIGDRWDTIAYKFYGNAARWYILALANDGVNGSIFIKPGTFIKIPEL
jgi:nucleoid-associated protein YgaU